MYDFSWVIAFCAHPLLRVRASPGPLHERWELTTKAKTFAVTKVDKKRQFSGVF